jgi:hypothetical protein
VEGSGIWVRVFLIIVINGVTPKSTARGIGEEGDMACREKGERQTLRHPLTLPPSTLRHLLIGYATH